MLSVTNKIFINVNPTHVEQLVVYQNKDKINGIIPLIREQWINRLNPQYLQQIINYRDKILEVHCSGSERTIIDPEGIKKITLYFNATTTKTVGITFIYSNKQYEIGVNNNNNDENIPLHVKHYQIDNPNSFYFSFTYDPKTYLMSSFDYKTSPNDFLSKFPDKPTYGKLLIVLFLISFALCFHFYGNELRKLAISETNDDQYVYEKSEH